MPRRGMIEEALREFILETIAEHIGSQTTRSNQEESVQRFGIRFRRGAGKNKKTTSKGRVTNPATDKRLKANRKAA